MKRSYYLDALGAFITAEARLTALIEETDNADEKSEIAHVLALCENARERLVLTWETRRTR